MQLAKMLGLSVVLVATCVSAQERGQGTTGNPLSGLNDFLKGVTASINSAALPAGGSAQDQTASAAAGGQGNKIARTKLANLFAGHPATGDGAPEWPKIAISISEIPRSQLEHHYISQRPTPGECMRFSIKLWRNAKTVETFNDLQLCGSDIVPGVSFSKLTVWKSFPVSGKTAGQVRTGPTPPYNKLPSSPNLDRWLANETGYYYLGSLLHSVGYDWNYAPDSRRVWVERVQG